MDKLNQILDFRILQYGKYHLLIGDLVAVLVIILIVKILLTSIRKIFDKLVQNKRMDERNMQSFMLLIRYVVMVIAVVLSLETMGVQITILLAGSAALLVGLGLGLQQIFSDIVSGVFLLLEGSVKIGDIMEVDGLIGKVTSIKLRTSEILTRDGIVIIVPNHKFITENVVNWSHNSEITRFNVKVGVAYGTDSKLVKEILAECAKENKEITTTGIYTPLVRLINFGDSSLDFELLFWSKKVFTIENTKSDLRFQIVTKFSEKGIQIPFPQRDLHLKSGKF